MDIEGKNMSIGRAAVCGMLFGGTGALVGVQVARVGMKTHASANLLPILMWHTTSTQNQIFSADTMNQKAVQEWTVNSNANR